MGVKIGVISDTHGLLRNEVKGYLKGCDRIFHAGDINKPSVLEELNQIAPTYAVRGNADSKEWAGELPEVRVIGDIGIRVLMIHNKKKIAVDLEPYDLVICGHSHKYEEKTIDGRAWLNPGSCGPRRFKLPITMAALYVEDSGSFRIEKIEIPYMGSELGEAAVEVRIKEELTGIIRDIDKGMTVEQMVRKYQISKELSEQICRLYLTHPGIDAEGIIRKMGI